VSGDAALAQAVINADRSYPMPERLRTLLDFGVLVARDVHAVNPARLDALRAQGLSDAEILTCIHVAGFFSYYNRLADATGIDLETFMPPPMAAPAVGPD
jgi:uncharacterized peroxidase-related enzyme